MTTFVPLLISGLVTGSVYGLAGTGLVVTYKTSGIFNFGYGAIATAGAYSFYFLHYRHGVNWIVAALVAVIVLGAALAFVMEIIARRLARQSTAFKIVGTVGLVLIAQGLGTIVYGPTTINVGPFLPDAHHQFTIGGVHIQYGQLTIFGVALLAVAGFYFLFSRTRLGVEMRAVVDDPDLVAAHAVNPVAVRRAAWLVGCIFATMSGVLVLPLVGLDGITITFLVVEAFGAAAIGAFSSIPWTFAGGLIIGVIAAWSTKYVLDVSWLAGLPASLPFIALIVVMLALPKRRLVAITTADEQRTALQWRGPWLLRGMVATALLIPLVLVPHIVGATVLPFYTIAATQAIMLLGLGLLVRTSGQISLCQATFAAIGAVAFSQFTALRFPWFVSLLLAALVAVPVGALVALPAIRLSGLFVALATFGFGLTVQSLLYSQGYMFTVLASGRPMPRPSLARSDTDFYYLVLAILVVVGLAMLVIERSRLGRMLRGMGGAPGAMSTLGLNVNVTRLIVFCISAFVAGLSGVLYGATIHFATSSDSYFTPLYSLVLLAELAIAPFGAPWYVLPGMIAAGLPAYLTSAHTTSWLNVIFGYFAITVAMQGGPPVMPPRWRAVLDRVSLQGLGLLRDRPPAAPVAASTSLVRAWPTIEQAEVKSARGLEVSDLTIDFDALRAVDGLTLEAPCGRVTGLIGPNGAGKTSTFDAINGINRRISGSVFLHGENINSLDVAARARRGLGRTFQRVQLAESLTVLDNVAFGYEATDAGSGLHRQFAAAPRAHREMTSRATIALELCGIAHLSDTQAGALSTGQRRLAELARCLAGTFDVLLLDEPSSGLDPDETLAFAAVLEQVVRERQCGLLLVEHDMSLVTKVCHHVYVLDFGRLVFQGSTAELVNDATVQAAYLGDGESAPQPVKER